MYHQFVEVSRSSFLIVRLRHHISYDIVSTISVQSLVDGRTMRLVILTRDHLMYDRCDAHLSLISRSPDSSSSLHLSGSPGVCTRCKSREETAKTLESNLSSYSYWRWRLGSKPVAVCSCFVGRDQTMTKKNEHGRKETCEPWTGARHLLLAWWRNPPPPPPR